MYEFNLDSLKVIGKEKILVNGGTDINKNPIWIEGPHIFKKDGYYYLIAAEGGTGDQHSEVVFRSKNCEGPYESFEHNPILTQRHLDPKRKFAITCTGHADLVQTEQGDWWAVFLGCRPYPPVEEGYYNTGRETFLAPVKWENGWPVINPGKEEVQYHYQLPLPPNKSDAERLYSGNFTWRDEFDKDTLCPDWTFLRTPHEKWYDLTTRKGSLALHLRQETCAGNMNPSFLGHRQQHLRGSVSTEIDFFPKAENEKAGLLIFQNEEHFYFLCKSLEENESVIQLYRSSDNALSKSPMELIAFKKLSEDQQKGKVLFKIEANGNSYSFCYGFKPDQWNLLKDNVDAKYVSTKVAGGFVGSMYALYATSLGRPSTAVSYFDWFEYQGNDEVYK